MTAYSLAFLAAAIATLALTPLVRWIARRADIVDCPDGRRKLQKRPIPLLGGVAVLAGWWIGIAVYRLLVPGAVLPRVALPAGASLLLVAMLGIVDDAFRLRARWKLLGQAFAVLPVVLSGCSDHIALGGHNVDLGIFSIPAATIWLVLGINSINLLDGMDGMVSVVSIGIAATLTVMAALGGHAEIALVMLPLLGALIGFLVFNFPPAKIYIGDAGTSVIGLALALACLLMGQTGAGSIRPTILAAVMAIPLADTTLAILRRSLSGHGFWHPDRAHIHHKLLDRGFRPKQVLALFFVLSLIWAPIVVVAHANKTNSLAFGTAVVAGILSVRLRIAGHHEWALLSVWIRRSRAWDLVTAPSPTQLGEMPFAAAWNHLVSRLRQLPIDSVVLLVEDGSGSLAEQSWRREEASFATSAIEIVHGSLPAACCRLRIESSQAISGVEWSRLVRVADRFATFWAAHPDTVPATVLAFSVGSPPRPRRWQAADATTDRRAA